MSFLEVESLDVRHGLLQAVRGVSFHVDKSEIVAFIGANGAGKTTLFRAIAGAHAPVSGRVVFEGADVTTMPVHDRVRAGIALVPEGRRLFTQMSIRENLLLAGDTGRSGQWNLEAVLDVFPNLKPRLGQKTGTLSGGEQQATAIARALMTNPDMLLLDEVSLGLSPAAVDRVYESVETLIRTGTTLLLVEQDLNKALSVANRVICMLEGRIVAQGPVSGMSRERIMQAYFGTGGAGAGSAS